MVVLGVLAHLLNFEGKMPIIKGKVSFTATWLRETYWLECCIPRLLIFLFECEKGSLEKNCKGPEILVPGFSLVT